jgi:tRNA uridine 5-carbamoylmethylation protein Kti12
MPLVVLCGLPAAGKTRVAEALAQHLEREHGKQVCCVSEAAVNVDKLRGYSGASFGTCRSSECHTGD